MFFLWEFKNRKDATSYTESYWAPEPDETVSEEEYAIWENNNPKWKMESDLNCYLNADFIETIIDDNKFEYLYVMIENHKNVKHLKTELQKMQLIYIMK